MNKDIIDSITKMNVVSNRLELPSDTIFTNYAAVKKTLIDAGGKYRKNGFDFKVDAQAIKDRLMGGEKVNDKKLYQQFYTPEVLAKKLVALAEIKHHHLVLEPSAGQAAIATIICDNGSDCDVVEIDPVNIEWLKDNGWGVVEGDFLLQNPNELGLYDRIVANPPFTKNQDIVHIKHMYDFLKPGGIMVSLSSKSWQLGNQSRQVEFRCWLESREAKVISVAAGSFKESGTNIETAIIKITKTI